MKTGNRTLCWTGGGLVRTMLTAALAAAMISPLMIAATVGQMDTFQDNTTDNWFSGGPRGEMPPTPPHVVAGGKGGASDLYMVLTAIGGDGPGSKISVINTSQWTGNYLTSGIDFIAMDLINLGSTILDV